MKSNKSFIHIINYSCFFFHSITLLVKVIVTFVPSGQPSKCGEIGIVRDNGDRGVDIK